MPRHIHDILGPGSRLHTIIQASQQNSRTASGLMVCLGAAPAYYRQLKLRPATARQPTAHRPQRSIKERKLQTNAAVAPIPRPTTPPRVIPRVPQLRTRHVTRTWTARAPLCPAPPPGPNPGHFPPPHTNIPNAATIVAYAPPST